jgi:hypothetical protein
MNRMRMCMCLVSLCMLVISAMSFGQVQQLPISAYLDQVPIDWWWFDNGWTSAKNDNFLFFDVYGVIAQEISSDFGTTFDGKVTIRELADGRARVSLVIHTKNALCFGYQGDWNYAFGNDPNEVIDEGRVASLGEGTLTKTYTIDSPESPLIDLEDPYANLESTTAVINCSGVLREATGFPEGTPGRAHVTQQGLFLNEVPKNCPAGDCWPVETVDFKPVGQ